MFIAHASKLAHDGEKNRMSPLNCDLLRVLRVRLLLNNSKHPVFSGKVLLEEELWLKLIALPPYYHHPCNMIVEPFDRHSLVIYFFFFIEHRGRKNAPELFLWRYKRKERSPIERKQAEEEEEESKWHTAEEFSFSHLLTFVIRRHLTHSPVCATVGLLILL